jgi:hypothetical protein
MLALVVGVIGFESTGSVGLIAVGTSLLSLNGFAEERVRPARLAPGRQPARGRGPVRRPCPGLCRPPRRRPVRSGTTS